MRIFSIAILLALSIQQISAQSGQELIRLNNVNGINSIQAPIHKGNMAYESGEKILYYRDNTAWINFKPWELLGNNNTNYSSYIGTINNEDFRVRTNNSERFLVKSTGEIGIGNNAEDGLFSVGTTYFSGVLPKMTANTDHGIIVDDRPYLAYVSGNYPSTISIQEPYLAFDKDPNTYWEHHNPSSINPSHLVLDLGANNIQGFDAIRVTRGPEDTKLPCRIRYVACSSFSTNSLGAINAEWNSYDVIQPYSICSQSYLNQTQNNLQDTIITTFFNIPTPTRRYHVVYFGGTYNNITRYQIAEIELLKKVPEFVVYANGNTSIGASNSNERLFVGGNVVATSITPTPDYVFETYYNESSSHPYEQIPLEKTKSFVEKNHHLPNIKSAKQIEKEGGILLNEAIPKNLEKIEEAFLYVFELNSRLKSLEEKIESLEK